MGMTIAEHMAQLKKLKSFHNGSYGASINFAIDTMRKYQIIVNDLKACEQDGMEFISVSFLKEIIDGNVD